MNVDGLNLATADDRARAVAAGLTVPDEAPCWTRHGEDGPALAFVVLLPGDGERRVRAVAAGDPADPRVADAVVSAREAVLGALAAGP